MNQIIKYSANYRCSDNVIIVLKKGKLVFEGNTEDGIKFYDEMMN